MTTSDPTGPEGAGHNGDGAPSRLSSTGLKAKAIQWLTELTTTRLWLGALILSAISVGLILLAFAQGGPDSDSWLVYLLAQLGTGLLVGAVGAALLQVLVTNVRRRYEKEMTDLGMTELRDTLTSLSSDVRTLKAEMEAHNAQTADATTASLKEIGVTRAFRTRSDAAPAIREALTAPTVSEIRLLGVTLKDFFSSDERNCLHEAWSVIEGSLRGNGDQSQQLPSLQIRALILDPFCLSARLLVMSATDHDSIEHSERLRHYVELVVDHFTRLERSQLTETNVSFELRLMRLAPKAFLCATDNVTFMQPYLFTRLRDLDVQAAMLMCGQDASLHHEMRDYFDLMWDVGTALPTDVVHRGSKGIDQGAAESGLVNIYAEVEEARKRLVSLIEGAEQRIWIQGISLFDFERALSRVLEGIIEQDRVDVRMLILDPDSEAAVFKSFNRNRAASSSESWSSYKDTVGAHRGSRLYTEISESRRRLAALGRNAPKTFHARVYDSPPSSFLCIVEDRALVEQYHFGSNGPPRSTSRIMPLVDDMALLEYREPSSELFPLPSSMARSPFRALEESFNFVFEHFSHPI